MTSGNLFGDQAGPIPIPTPRETGTCPACGCNEATVRLRPDTIHHAELRCPRCRHHRWLPNPKTEPKGPDMPRTSDMFPSKWLKASDCEDGDLTLTIEKVVEESIGQGNDAADKWVVYFAEETKGLVLNKTNMNTIAKLHGDDTDDWIGKPVTLFSTEVQFKDEMVEAIRIRSKPPKAVRTPKAAVAKPATAPTATRDDDEDIPF